jgi:hypothetical protein
MKKSNTPWLYSAILLLFLSSCTKEKVTPVPVTPVPVTPIAPVHQSWELQLVVTNWQIDRNNLFSATLTGILRYDMSASAVNVYAIPDNGGSEVLISRGPVYFSGGQLWSERSGYDVKIMFRPDYRNTKSFEKLAIKIVFV